MSFYNMAIMKGVVTMGRSDALEWVTHYKIRYQYDYYSEWNWYEEPPGQVKVRMVTASSGTLVPVRCSVSGTLVHARCSVSETSDTCKVLCF